MKIPIVDPLLFSASRKVSFGVCLAITSTLFYGATVFASRAGLAAEQWLFCMAFSGVLIGGGTVIDSWIKMRVGKQNAPTS